MGAYHHKDKFDRSPVTGVDKDRNVTVGAVESGLECQYTPSGEIIRGDAGQVVARKDLLITHHEVSEGDMVWPPGATAPNVAEGRRPESVEVTGPNSRGKHVYKVVL